MSNAEMTPADLLHDGNASARKVGLHYVSDEAPGWTRKKFRKAFRYVDQNGKPVPREHIARIDALRIPPAWTGVWICPDPKGHLQATGRDARGRKQYRYHDSWRQVRDETKFEKILDFAHALPKLRARVDKDLSRPSLSRERVLATAVRIIDTTLIRVGNEEYTRENGSYGLTTLRRRHLSMKGDQLRFQFRGKSGKERALSVRDRRVARVLRRCQDLPGQVLLKYIDDQGTVRTVSSEDVNAYLREATGEDFTAKDFRTWAATVLAGLSLQQLAREATQHGSIDKQISACVRAVAECLGNTPAVCRKSYVHPEVLNAHREGALIAALQTKASRSRTLALLRQEERSVLAFLLARFAREKKPKRGAALAKLTRHVSRKAESADAPKPRQPRVASQERSRARAA